MKTIKRAVLEELVYECVRQYAKLWETTQYAQALVEHIDRTKTECADTTADQQSLIDEYTQRAWTRVAETREPARA